jgi:hypothetical protein
MNCIFYRPRLLGLIFISMAISLQLSQFMALFAGQAHIMEPSDTTAHTTPRISKNSSFMKSSHSICGCGDVYNQDIDRCVQNDPSVLLWFGGYQEGNTDFITKFSKVDLGHYPQAKIFQNAGCQSPHELASWIPYSYHWLESAKANNLYRTCKHLNIETKICLEHSELEPPPDKALASMGRPYVCQAIKNILLYEPNKRQTTQMTLNLDDVTRALSFREDVPPNWANVMLNMASSFCSDMQNIGNSLLFPVKDMVSCCQDFWSEGSSSSQESKSAKIAVMTISLNEESTLIFTVGALLDHVDLYIVIDTGTVDNSVHALRKLFPLEVASGKFLIHQTKVGISMSEARNLALDLARQHRCTHILKIDADDVFYNNGAAQVVRIIRSMPRDIQLIWVPQWELVQWTANTTSEWLKSVESDIWGGELLMQGRFFRKTDRIYGHDRVYLLTDDLQAKGSWADEAHGLPAESLYHSKRGKFMFLVSDEPLIIHYGWARPLQQLERKEKLWGYKDVGGLHMPGNYPHDAFSLHPEVFKKFLKEYKKLVSHTAAAV